MKKTFISVILALGTCLLFTGCLFLDTLAVFVPGGSRDKKDMEIAFYYDTTNNVYLPKGDTPVDNAWNKTIQEKLGFEVSYKFAVTQEQYVTKINADILSGDIPDAFSVTANQLPDLIDSKQTLDDYGPLFAQYATPLTKQIMGWDDELGIYSPGFKTAVVDGKLRAIPRTMSSYDDMTVMYIRKDWLDQIQRDIPTTLDDLTTVLNLFKTKVKSPDGGYNTRGFAAQADLIYSNAGAVSGIFDAYGAHMPIFVKLADGATGSLSNDDSFAEGVTLDYGYLQPQVKEGLALLKTWYNNGLLYSGFTTATTSSLGERIASGDIGIWNGCVSLPLYKTNDSIINIPGADWVCAPIPKRDASSAEPLVTRRNPILDYYVVKQDYPNPERLIEMMNLFTEMNWGGSQEDYDKHSRISSFFPFQAWSADRTLEAHERVQAALDADRQNSEWWAAVGKRDGKGTALPPALTFDESAGDTRPEYYSLNNEQRDYYVSIVDFLKHPGDITDNGFNWARTRVFYSYEDPNGLTMMDGRKGFDCAQAVIRHYRDDNLIYYEKFDSIATATLSQYKGPINDQISILMKNIITGASLSTFDAGIAEIRSGRAGTVVREINDWYSSMREAVGGGR